MFKRKVTTEYVRPTEYKDWKDAGPEIERIGQRLDAVRTTLKTIPKGKRYQWSRTHWTQIESHLLNKWRMMNMLKDTGLRQIAPGTGTAIDYSWWEKSEEVGLGTGFSFDTWIGNKLADMALQSRLEESWLRSKDLSFQKARQGLA